MTEKDQILAKWISGDISDEAFKKYVSDEEYAEYLKLRKGISLYAMTQKPLDDKMFENIKQSAYTLKKKEQRKKMIVSFSAIAAMLLLFLGINHFISPSTFKVETAYGEQKEITLPDGSTVLLGAKSKLSYNTNDWNNHKDVFLEGDAYFNVNSDNFTVTTSNGQIKAHKSKFAVSSISDFLNIKNFEGKAISISKNNYKIPALEMYQKAGDKTLKLPIKNSTPLWIKGESRFRATPLKYVIIAIEKQYGIKFERQNIDDDVLFTGSFTHHNLPLTLNIVFKALQIDVTQKNSHIYVLKK